MYRQKHKTDTAIAQAMLCIEEISSSIHQDQLILQSLGMNHKYMYTARPASHVEQR